VQFAIADPAGAVAPPTLGSGVYGFQVFARDSACRRIALGCAGLDLPQQEGETVEVGLATILPRADCAPVACSGGICVHSDGGVVDCPEGFADCNGDPTDDCEVELDRDVDHCGGCGLVCRAAHGTPQCSGGICTVRACDTDWADCDGDPSNGCEASLRTRADCGVCGNECIFLHASGSCDDGSCAMGACHDGWADCDGVASNGCETDLGTGSDCGSCGTSCPGATPNCALDTAGVGTCVLTCPAGAATLCGTSCTDTTTDPHHCGGCTTACSLAHASGRCAAGACAVDTCDEGWGDCDVTAASGCEASLATLDNCGGCSSACFVEGGFTECPDGACHIDRCFGAMDDCDDLVSTGCEADLASATTCGSCETSCEGATPVCGVPPDGGRQCLADCAPPAATECGDRCIDTGGDLANCGGCGMRCELPDAAEICVGGQCLVSSCPEGRRDCDGNAANGCESLVVSDPDNCGACGLACTAPAGSEASCVGGVCMIGCEPGLADCNSDPADGCEVTLGTVMNCGACGDACIVEQGTGACTGGSCGVGSCDPGFDDCDGILSTGCEANLNTDRLHCGTCDTRCPSSSSRRDCCAGVCGSCP